MLPPFGNDRKPPEGPTNTPQELAAALQAGDRRALAQTITLVESTRPKDRPRAAALLQEILPNTGMSQRIGNNRCPGNRREQFYRRAGFPPGRTAKAHRRARLGPVLGDHRRQYLRRRDLMERVSQHPSAFIRPSPTAGTLGGIARRSREALLLCEAAGYDLVMVDCVVLLMLAGTVSPQRLHRGGPITLSHSKG